MAKSELGQDLDVFGAPDLTGKDYAEHHAQTIAGALEKTGLVEVADAKASEAGQVHLMFRVNKDNERKLVHEVGLSILRHVRGKCENFFGKEYFIKAPRLDQSKVPAVSYGDGEVQKFALELSTALEDTGLLEVVERKWSDAGQVHLLFRVNKEKEKKLVQDLAEPLLFSARGLADSFFGKEYFIKDNALRYGWVFSLSSSNIKMAVEHAIKSIGLRSPMPGALRYGWVLSFAAKDLQEPPGRSDTVRDICEAIDAVVPRYEVSEAPLLGPPTPIGGRGMGSSKRGAAPIRGN